MFSTRISIKTWRHNVQIEKHLDLTTENKKKLDAIFIRINESEFLKFCVINEIFEEGTKLFFKKYRHNDSFNPVNNRNVSQNTDGVTDG